MKARCYRRARRVVVDEAGAGTVEAALGVAAVVSVATLCMAAVGAGATYIQCVDAAREAARLAARGDMAGAREATARLGPRGAELRLVADGGLATAEVGARVPVLPVTLRATAVAADEGAPGGVSGDGVAW